MTKTKYSKNRAIRAFTVIFAVIAAAALFSACGKVVSGQKKAVLDSPFTSDISVRDGDLSFEGVLVSEKIREDGAVRDALFTFTSPESLSGITAERRNGKVTLSLDGISADAESFSEMLSFLRVFEKNCDADVTFDGDVPLQIKENADDGVVCEIRSFDIKDQ